MWVQTHVRGFSRKVRTGGLIDKIIRNIKADSWLIVGREKGSREELAVFYAGCKYSKNYFCKLIYGNYCYAEEYLGEKWIWDILRTAPGGNEKPHLIIAESFHPLRGCFQKEEDFIIPAWISATVDISGPQPPFLRNRSLKNDIRRINKNGFQFVISREESQFDNFYFNMYKPHIERVYNEEGVIEGYSHLKRIFLNNGLLGFVKKSNEIMGGGLLLCRGKKGAVWRLGVKDGNGDYIREGAMQALFCFALDWFRKKGYKNIDFGSCRPFLNDGVLRFKKKWSPTVGYKKWTEKIFLLRPLVDSRPLRSFLVNNPFVFIKNGRLNAAVFINEDCPLYKGSSPRNHKFYRFRGLAGLYFFKVQGSIKDQPYPRLAYSQSFKNL